MLPITIKDLLNIKYYLEVVISHIVLVLLWSRIKKQTIYIDTTKYKFTYTYKKMWLMGFHLYVKIANHGLKNFSTIKEFKKSGTYQVIFLNWS